MTEEKEKSPPSAGTEDTGLNKTLPPKYTTRKKQKQDPSENHSSKADEGRLGLVRTNPTSNHRAGDLGRSKTAPWIPEHERRKFRNDRKLLKTALTGKNIRDVGNEYCCPFHNDRNASGSFHEAADSSAWLATCHGNGGNCGWNQGKNTGDVFAVMQKHKDCSFPEALAHVRDLAIGHKLATLPESQELEAMIECILPKDPQGQRA